MPNETPKLIRWRETKTSEPSGFGGVVHTLARVVEGEGPVPDGCEATNDPVSDWTLKETH